MGIRRFTRLTNAFSKKLENHAHHVALMLMYYNSAASTRRCGDPGAGRRADRDSVRHGLDRGSGAGAGSEAGSARAVPEAAGLRHGVSVRKED